MNAVIDALLARVSVRKFTDQKIEDEKLKLIADCAKAAPSGKNRQARKFTIVHNREKIQELAQAIAKVHNRSDYRIYDCDAILLISFAEDDIYGQCDSSCAIENTYLAAEAPGLGAVWINQLRDKCNEPDIRKVLDSFHIPSNHVICGFVALGYPAEKPAPKERTEPVEFIQ